MDLQQAVILVLALGERERGRHVAQGAEEDRSVEPVIFADRRGEFGHQPIFVPLAGPLRLGQPLVVDDDGYAVVRPEPVERVHDGDASVEESIRQNVTGMVEAFCSHLDKPLREIFAAPAEG